MLDCPRRYGCLHLQHPRRHPASDRTHRSVLSPCREILRLRGMAYSLPYPRLTDHHVYQALATHPGHPKPAFAQTPPCTAISFQIASSHHDTGLMPRALSRLPSSRVHLTCIRRRYRRQMSANTTRNNSQRMTHLRHRCGRCTPEPRQTCRTHNAWRT